MKKWQPPFHSDHHPRSLFLRWVKNPQTHSTVVWNSNRLENVIRPFAKRSGELQTRWVNHSWLNHRFRCFDLLHRVCFLCESLTVVNLASCGTNSPSFQSHEVVKSGESKPQCETGKWLFESQQLNPEETHGKYNFAAVCLVYFLGREKKTQL